MLKKLDSHTIRVLEFPRIREILKTYLETEVGLSRAESLYPETAEKLVKKGLKETSEIKDILLTSGSIPFLDIKEPGSVFDILRKKDSVLEPFQILYIDDVLSASRRLREFFSHLEKPYPNIEVKVKRFYVSSLLEKNIHKVMNREGEILDSASSELLKIRENIKRVKEEIKDILNLLIESRASVVQEPIITVRDGRYVVPLKPNFQKTIKGIVHGESASRATVFVEPLEVLELNNRIRNLEAEEKREKLRILKKLTDEIRKSAVEIENDIDVLAELDLISAKARYSIESKSSEPVIHSENRVHFRQARNPLLEWDRKKSKEETVPVDIRIGKDFNVLVITGPNTGGKTITLKTLGLLSLMVQSGMHIPVLDGSETSVFQNIFADVGDEQSIQQNLSTFSSHMRQIIKIVKEADSSSLVLLDELGAGTDPSEGAALGMAILENLKERGSNILATTHHNALKVFAHSCDGVENASVEFDVKTLRPTYRLMYGFSGKSSAFAIAENLGLPESLISRAVSELSQERDKTDGLIDRLEYQLRDIEEYKREIEKERSETERKKEEQALLMEELKREKSVFRSEAKTFLREMKKEAKSLINELKKTDKRPDEAFLHGRFDSWKSRIEDLEKVPFDMEKGHLEPRIGDKVKIESIGQMGIISGFRSPTVVEVQIGVKKIHAPLSDLSRSSVTEAAGTGKEKRDINISVKSGLKKDFHLELNVIGNRVDEAIPQVDKYLDDAKISGLKTVRIVHGKGTGRLKKAISEMLQDHPLVKNFYSGSMREGGWGATIVEINQS